MRKVYPLLNATSRVVADGGTLNIDFVVPHWAIGAIFFLDASAMAGTAETLDLKFQHAMQTGGTFKDVVGGGIVQLTAAADILMTIDPRITAAANVQVACALSSAMRAVFALEIGGAADQTYTLALAVEYYS